MQKSKFSIGLAMLSAIILTVPAVSMGSVKRAQPIFYTLTKDEAGYYSRLTSSEREDYDRIVAMLGMGSTQRLNALRYKFEDMLVADKSLFGPARAFAKFLADTIRGVSADGIMDSVYNLFLYADVGSEKGRVITVNEVIGWINPAFWDGAKELVKFAYKGPTNLLTLR